MTEHQVVVVFDVTADNRLDAARAVVGVVNATRGFRLLPDGHLADTTVESWWFPEPDLKQVDRNDNAIGLLVFDDDLPTCYYCGGRVTDWPAASCEDPEQHANAVRECECGDTVTIADATAQPGKHRCCHLIGSRS